MDETLELPGGVWLDDGRLVQDASVRALTGADEQWLADCPPGRPTASVLSGLLARIVTRLGERRPEPGDVRDLLVGDRDFLLLAARRLTLGDRVGAVLACPECAEPMDLDFSVDEIPVRRPNPLQRRLELVVSGADDRRLEIGFRLPTGADQEALAGTDRQEAERALLRRCVETIDGEPVAPGALARLNGLSDPIAQAMQSAAPAVDLAMDLDCPACGARFGGDYELAPFLLRELHTGAGQLVREVHALAFHYRWGEAEILALPRARRRAYAELIDSELLHADAP
jgi:hypothetical protein